MGFFRVFLCYGFILTLILTLSLPANAKPIQLTVDNVVQAVLDKSLVQREIDINYQKSEAAIFSSGIAYDPFLNMKWNREDSKAESIAGLSNPHDKTESFSVGVGKKWRTGSYLGLDYSKISRDSELSGLMRSLLTPSVQYQNVTSLTFKQDLWNNSFGYQDQLKQEVASLTTERASLERDEATEDLLISAVKLFWDTYSAQESWKQSLAAQEKFRQLYKNIEKKHTLGFDDRSELLKTKAELQNQEKNINSAQLAFTTLVEKLYSLSNSPRPTEVELVATEIVAPPQPLPSQTTAHSYEDLRKIKSIDKALAMSTDELEIAKNNAKPALNFILQNSYYGLDAEQSPSFKEMTDQNKAKYMVGLEFSMRFDNSQAKTEQLTKRLQYEEALNQKEKLKIQLQEALIQSERNLQSKYVIYTNARDTLKVWDNVIQNQEKSHRLGRLTTSELLMDYGSYFRSKAALSQAIADYKVTMYDHKAIRDQLLKSKN